MSHLLFCIDWSVLISRDKYYLVIVYDLFNVLLDGFSLLIFCWKFLYLYSLSIILFVCCICSFVCLFCSVLIWLWCLSNTGLIKWVSPLYHVEIHWEVCDLEEALSNHVGTLIFDFLPLELWESQWNKQQTGLREQKFVQCTRNCFLTCTCDLQSDIV